MIRFLFNYLSFGLLFSVLFLLGLNIVFYILSTRNKAIAIGAGMILGPTAYLLLLSTNGYLYKGPSAIQTYSVALASITLYFTLKNWNKVKSLFKLQLTKKNLLVGVLFLSISLVITLYSGTVTLGGDVMTQWSIGNSFVRGNYPTVQPWQPEYLTAYHQGTYMLLGAFAVVTKQNITYVHIFFSIYILIALQFLLTGLAYEKNKNVAAFLPAIGAIFIFAPVLLISSLQTLMRDLNFLHQFPTYNQIKIAPGGGAQDLDSLIYLNFITYGLGLFIVILNILKEDNTTKKRYSVVTFSVMILAINEAMFLILVPFLVLYLKQNRIRHLLSISILFIILFCTIQNPIRDSLVTPTWDKSPRFDFLFKDSEALKKRLDFINTKTETHLNSNWLVPDARIMIIVALITAILISSEWGKKFAISALICLAAALTVNNTYWPENGNRFTNQANQFALIAVFFVILDGFNKKNHAGRIIGTTLLLVIIPSLVVTTAKVSNRIALFSYPNLFIKRVDPVPILEWVNNNIAYNKKLAFLDEYPSNSAYSPLTLAAIFQYGMYIPTVDHGPKVNNYDNAGEYLEIAANLAPYAIKDLGVDYIYIKKNRPEEIPSFLQEIHQDGEGVLYKVTEKINVAKDKEVTFQEILKPIGKKKKVFVDSFLYPEIRKEIFVKMFMNNNEMYGQPYLMGNDNYLFIEAPIKIRQDTYNRVDFALLNNNNTPDNLLLPGTFINMSRNRFITLWKNN